MVRSGKKHKSGRRDTRYRFLVLVDGMEDEPSIPLVGDYLARNLDIKNCDANKNRRLCYLWAELENLTQKVPDIVMDTTEDSVVVDQAGTNNVVQGRPEDIPGKYTTLFRKLKDNRRLWPRNDVGFAVSSKMLGTFSGVEGTCETGLVEFISMWDSFICDSSLQYLVGRGVSKQARLARAPRGTILKRYLAGLS